MFSHTRCSLPTCNSLRPAASFPPVWCVDSLPAIVAAEDAGFPEACFKISYDYLVLGVG